MESPPLTSTAYTVEYIATKGSYTRQATTTVKTASATVPSIQSEKAYGTTLTYDLTANLQNTGITDQWTLSWSSSPSATFTDTTTSQTQVTFGSYDTVYTVTLVATPPSATIAPVTAPITINSGLAPAYTQATYTVYPDTGTTAQAVANYYNNTAGLPGGIASITASGDSLIFTCKDGYEMAGAAATLAVGSSTTNNQGLQPVRTPTGYTSVLYASNGAGFSNSSSSGASAYNGFILSEALHQWGVNCYVSNNNN